MQFLPELKEFLRTEKTIYTVRQYDMVRAYVLIIDVGVCKRIPLGKVSNYLELADYYKLSGFSTLEDWISKIDSIISNKALPRYLYRIELEKEIIFKKTY